jgi:beta-lactamase regulating signal transducer with metallopeptidase domain
MRDFLTAMLPCAASMTLITLVYAAFMPLLLKRYTAKWRYRAWMLIAAGWVFPFRPRIELPFLPLKSANMPGVPVWSIANAIPFMTDTGDIANISAAILVWPVLAAVWILGVMTITAYHVLRHWHFIKMARRWSEPVTATESLRLLDGLKSDMGIKANVELNMCESVATPMLVGFFRPVILLPRIKITGDELYFVLKHELVHFQRRDLWGKALILMATALHWFNPAVYLMARAAAAQCELSCDALVLRDADFHRRKQYGETIIGVIRNGAKLRAALSTNFDGGKNSMKKRIFAIMDTKQKKVGAAIFCMVLASVITIGTAVAAASTDNMPAVAPDNGIGAVEGGIGDTILFNNQTRQVRVDGGTWMDREEYNKLYPRPNIVWWTYEEYKAYVDEQKKTLPDLIGQSYDYYDEQGVLHQEVWTQEKVDKAIQRYEQLLESIKNGAWLSKSIDGHADGDRVIIGNLGSASIGYGGSF